MSLFIVQGRGAGSTWTLWVPGDPGQPNHADSKEELLAWSPRPEQRPCFNAECGNLTAVHAHSPWGRWQWARYNFCRRCQSLRKNHGLELSGLVALWEAQGRRCYRYPGCRKALSDPRGPSPKRGAAHKGEDGTWEIRIDHDHLICPQERHSCERCRRGLACNACNCHDLSINSRGLWVLPQKTGELHRWLEFLGPEGRGRLRAGLTLFPEQAARRIPQRSHSEDASREGAVLFDLDAFREPA